MSKLPGSGSNTSLACRALPALAPAPPKIQNEKSSGSGSVVVKSKKSSGKLELWFTNLHILAMTGRGKLHFHLTCSQGHCHKCVRVTVLCELLCQGGHSDLHKGDGNKHFVCDKIRGWKNLKVKSFFRRNC